MGQLLGSTWTLLGRSWTTLGASWSQFWASKAPLGHNLEALGCPSSSTWPSQSQFWTSLGNPSAFQRLLRALQRPQPHRKTFHRVSQMSLNKCVPPNVLPCPTAPSGLPDLPGSLGLPSHHGLFSTSEQAKPSAMASKRHIPQNVIVDGYRREHSSIYIYIYIHIY